MSVALITDGMIQDCFNTSESPQTPEDAEATTSVVPAPPKGTEASEILGTEAPTTPKCPEGHEI